MEEWKDIPGFDGYQVSNLAKALLSERLVNERYYPEYLEGEDRLLYDPSF